MFINIYIHIYWNIINPLECKLLHPIQPTLTGYANAKN